MKLSLYLGTYKSIKVFVHWTFSLLLLWIVLSNYRAGADAETILWTLGFVLSLFFCVTLHEFGHALAAARYGIPTRDITLLPIGGVARLEKLPEDPKQELAVALAGPAVNIVIFLVLLLFIGLTGTTDLSGMDLEEPRLGAGNFLLVLASANVFIALFNMLPAFPMDGGRVLRAFLAIRMPREKATRIAGGIGQVLAVGFVFVGLFYNPILVLVGIFIFLGAGSEVAHTAKQSVLKGFTVQNVLMRKYQLLALSDPLALAVDKLLNSQATHFVVHDAQGVVGTLSRDAIIAGLQQGGTDFPIHRVVEKDALRLEVNEGLERAWQRMLEKNVKVALVFDQGTFVGILDQENVAEFVLVRNALRSAETTALAQ
ncbi:peptidase M50 [Nitritalea halalkaliphila LW7]|uniref:Zinc metalloprotease n=1 Tax=Nitritalea halalkaliphila LW7 TaxID=1189621 RepID=I5C2X5_9BACT|nr:site-2 protease family protein [Nitritalea halalkaliphila]EIM76177.1 peptidase M50 [Nitritalea halalkaliphila LW7]